jgi:hypothetical protein
MGNNGIEVHGREVAEGGPSMNPGMVGMEVAAGGDQISGKWINQFTGEVVNVRQFINDGDEGLVVTDKGTMSLSEFTNYIQCDESTTKMVAQPTQPSSYDSMMSEEDRKLISGEGPKNNFLDKPLITQRPDLNASTIHSIINIETKTPNEDAIDKLFKKFSDTLSTISFQMYWGDFPKDVLDSLVSILDIPEEEIAQYIIKHILTENKLKEIIAKAY